MPMKSSGINGYLKTEKKSIIKNSYFEEKQINILITLQITTVHTSNHVHF